MACKKDGKGGEQTMAPIQKAPKFMPLKNTVSQIQPIKSISDKKKELVRKLAVKTKEMANLEDSPAGLMTNTILGLPAAAKKVASFIPNKIKQSISGAKAKNSEYMKNLQKETDSLRKKAAEQNDWNRKNTFKSK